MKIVLVNPPSANEAEWVASEVAIPPFGIASIAGILEHHEFDVDLYDLALEWPLDIERLEDLGFFGADVFGFGSYTSTFPTAVKTVDLVRERCPDAIVVFGGPHAGPMPERILRRYPQIDAVVSRDGEFTFLELVKRLRGNATDFSDIPQLAYRGDGPRRRTGATDGSIHVNKMLAPQINRDELPWPSRRFLIEPDRYIEEAKGRDTPVRVEFMLGSTGCPKRCTFCSIIVMQPNYRSRGADPLLEEARQLYAAQPFGHLRFVDANFLAQTARVVSFSRALHAWRPHVRWSGTATADTVYRKRSEVMDLGALNCHSLEIGIESGSDPVLDRFGKGPNVATNEAAIAVLSRAGIELELDFIMFDPKTTPDDIRANLRFLTRNALVSVFPAHHIYNRLRLFPGTTEMFAYEELGLLSEDDLDTVIVPPLQDPAVALVYDAMERSRVTRSERLAALAVALDVIFRAGGRHGDAEHQHLRVEAAAISLELRHAPQRILSALVNVASEQNGCQAPPNADAAAILAHDLVALDDLQSRAESHLRAAVQAGLTALVTEGTAEQPLPTSLSPSWISLPLDDLVYVLDPVHGKVEVLNESAAWIWDRFCEGLQPDEVVARYGEWAGIAVEEARDETEFVQSRLMTLGLLPGADPGGNVEFLEKRSIASVGDSP